MNVEIIDQCANCGKSIYWGNEQKNEKKDPLDPKTWQYWRHEETQIGACSWERPIKSAEPINSRTPPHGATNVSDTLKAELKRVFPDEFPEY